MRVLAILVLAVLAALAAVVLSAARDLRETRARLAAGSTLVATAAGPVEVAERGAGPAVLVLHGAGGGYDQGLRMVEAFGPEGFRWIAGSRFGYLRAQLPPDASTAAQADALAALLDALGIERAAVLAMSGGVPPALQLARRHPGRVDRLVLLSSAPLTPLGAEAQRLPLPAWAYRALFVSDLPYWLMQRLGRGALGRIFDAPPERRAALDPGERGFLEATIDGFQPVTARRAGLANEGAAIDPAVDYGLAAIAAPALVVHAEDDGINPFPIGAWLADALPAATLRPLQDGGHLLLGHHSKVRRKVAAFLAEGR